MTAINEVFHHPDALLDFYLIILFMLFVLVYTVSRNETYSLYPVSINIYMGQEIRRYGKGQGL